MKTKTNYLYRILVLFLMLLLNGMQAKAQDKQKQNPKVIFSDCQIAYQNELAKIKTEELALNNELAKINERRKIAKAVLLKCNATLRTKPYIPKPTAPDKNPVPSIDPGPRK
jgi:hypothetical protein